MRRRHFGRTAALLVMLAAAFAPGGAQANHGGNHVILIDGTSTITQGCQYVWKQIGADPVRDELSIPQPATVPPTCRTGNPATGGGIYPCDIKRNLGSYPPPWRAGDVTKGEVGINPPCMGQISATEDPPLGCVDALTPDLACTLDAPTWFYGYCGQTYGGATGGTLRVGNFSRTIDRIGFTRGRGVWEFGGRLSNGQQMRFYLAAAPTRVNEAASCDVTGALTEITFNGTIIIGDVVPVKIFKPSPGWHFCADDPIIGPSRGNPAVVDGC